MAGAHLKDPSSHYRKYVEYARKMHAPRINYWKSYKPVHFVLSYVLPVTQHYKQRTAYIVKSISAIHPAIWTIRL